MLIKLKYGLIRMNTAIIYINEMIYHYNTTTQLERKKNNQIKPIQINN